MFDKRCFQFCIHGCEEDAPAPGAKRIKCRLMEDSVQRLSPTPLSLRFLSEILDLPEPRHRSMYSSADSAAKRILLKRYPPLFRSRLDNPRRRSAEPQCLLTCRQLLPSPFRRYRMLALPAQERCLVRRCSSVRPKPFAQRRTPSLCRWPSQLGTSYVSTSG